MSNQSVEQPFPLFFDSDGAPLENGYVYVGAENQNAEANPVNIFWDEDLTIPATNPVRTLNGYPSRSGSPGRIYVGSSHSLLIKDKNQGIVHSSLSKTLLVPSERIQFDVGLSGSVSRSLNSKLGEFLSVKDFGAKGDGATDDTTAIQAAMTYIAANGGSLFFPEGVYISTNVSVTLSAAVNLIGYQATLSFSVANGIGMQITGYPYDITISGITFDGNNTTARCLYIVEGGVLDISSCTFKSSHQTGANDNSGLRVEGRFTDVLLTRVITKDHSRDLGAGTPATEGTDGILITTDGSGNAPVRVVFDNCKAQDIKNGETAATTDNFNANGFRVEGKYSDYPTLTIVGCDFRTIKGSSIRTDNIARTVIDDVHVYRNIAGIGNAASDFTADIDVRGPTAEISNITFEYADAPSGEATLTRSVYPFGFYQGDAPASNLHYNLTNVRIQNLVFLASFKGVINADHAAQYSQDEVINATGFEVNGACDYFMVFPTTNSASIYRHANLKNIRCQLLNVGIAAVNLSELVGRNFLTLENFMHVTSGGTKVPAHFLVSSEPAPLTYSQIHAQIENTIGVLRERDAGGTVITTDTSNLAEKGFKSFGLQARNVAGDTADEAVTDTGWRVYSSVLDDDEDEIIPIGAKVQTGIFLITVASGARTESGLFVVDATGVEGIALPASEQFEIGTTSNPDVDTLFNIWYEATGNIGVKNRLGSSATMTIAFLG